MEYFDRRIIGINFWPPKLPDITPLDFFMFGLIYQTLLDLLENLRGICCSKHCQSDSHSEFKNVKRRVNAYSNVDGAHFDHNL